MPISPDGREPVNTETPQPNPNSRLMQERLSRREFLGRALGLGVTVGAAAILRPSETRAADGGLIGQFPPVEPTPEAESLMNRDFEETAKETLDNINRFKNWIEDEGGAEEFHQTFAEFRSELQQAKAFNVTPPELSTSVTDTITNQGPFLFPADFSDGEPKGGRFFGKVAIGKIPTGQQVDDNLLIGGEADVVLFGVTFHDFTSTTGAKGKVVLIHFGGVNESKAWNASGFWNVIWPDGEFYSPLSQFRVETDASNTQRQWPYDVQENGPPPQAGQAGINEMVKCVGKGMASISIGSTYNYDALLQWGKDYEEKYGINPYGGLAPDFLDKDFIFKTNAVGQKLLERLQLHAVNAMMSEAEISGRELGIVQFNRDGTRQDFVGKEAMKGLFPDAEDPKDWSKVRSTTYFLDRPTLTMEDIYKLPPILGAKRFAYPQEFPQKAGVVNPVY